MFEDILKVNSKANIVLFIFFHSVVSGKKASYVDKFPEDVENEDIIFHTIYKGLYIYWSGEWLEVLSVDFPVINIKHKNITEYEKVLKSLLAENKKISDIIKEHGYGNKIKCIKVNNVDVVMTRKTYEDRIERSKN